MIFIASAWSPSMIVGDHYILDFHKINREVFDKLSQYAHSCMNKTNLARILDIEYSPEHVQLRAGDTLITVHIKGGMLPEDAEELPRNVVLEFYCYSVYDARTHEITEKIIEK